MSISKNSIITWNDFTTRCMNAIDSYCCNIGTSFPSNVPSNLRDGEDSSIVHQEVDIGIAGKQTKWTASWYANPGNLIKLVSRDKITNSNSNGEWDIFLKNAGVKSRSNELIKAKELGLLIPLYMQFLSYHLKPIYSRRQIYNTSSAQTLFQGTRYVTGTVTPYYKLNNTGASSVPLVNPDTYDPQTLVKNNYMLENTSWAMFDAYNNPMHPYYSLS